MPKRKYTDIDRLNFLKLKDLGHSRTEISKILGIPYASMYRWIDRGYQFPIDPQPFTTLLEYLDSEEKEKAYVYILAIYLCDGHISTHYKQRAPCLILTNDIAYSNDINEWERNLATLLPQNKINVKKRNNSNAVNIKIYSKKLPQLFPTFKGTKHLNIITLTSEQEKLVKKHSHSFIRGCIQSDGSIFHSNNIKYFNFTNKSIHIMQLFLDSLKEIGIEKSLYYHKKRKLYVFQTVKKKHISILDTIISSKN